MRSARVMACILAVVLCAWFALDVRQQQQIDRAQAILDSGMPLTSARAEQARSALRAAGQVNPDTGVLILRAQLAADLGDRSAAVRILERVTVQEPENVVAWRDLAETAQPRSLVLYALEQFAALVPRVPGEH